MHSKLQNDSIGYLLIQVCKIRRNRANRLLAEYDIHAGQDVLLYYLGEEDGQTISDLVGKISISHATIVRMIDRMEANNLIRKVKDSDDMRVSRIFLTKDGKQALQKVAAVWQELEKLTLAGISEEEEDQLREILPKILKNFR